MTQETLERVKFYVEKTRLEFLASARNSRLNGYTTIAAEEENKAQIAKLILDDLASEHGEP
jgi:hypothetical protein